MTIKLLGTSIDKAFRNDLNANFDYINNVIKGEVSIKLEDPSDEVITTIGRSLSKFNGDKAIISGTGGRTDAAIVFVYDITTLDLTNKLFDLELGVISNDSNIANVLVQYRTSDSISNWQSDIGVPASNGPTIILEPGDIHTYKDSGRSFTVDNQYLNVTLYFTLKSAADGASFYYTEPTLTLNGVEADLVNDYPRNGAIAKESVEYSPSNLITYANKYDTKLTNFSDLTWNFIGDSITSSNGSFTTKYWHQYVNDELNFKQCNNYGIGGSTVAVIGDGSTNNPIVNRYSTMAADADFISVFAGTNDYSNNVPLGTMDSRDNATFYGAYHNLLSGFISKYPGKKIFTMTPLPRLSDVGFDLYIKAIKEVSAYYSIPCLDLQSASNLYPKNDTFKTNFMPDGIHPNAEGHKLFANKVLSFIKSL